MANIIKLSKNEWVKILAESKMAKFMIAEF